MAIYPANSGANATWVGIYPRICGIGRCGGVLADEFAYLQVLWKWTLDNPLKSKG